MPRTGGVYSPPAGTKGTSGTTIQSSRYNALVDDLTADANAARPITAGGTGATNATAARAALGLTPGTDVQAYDALLQSIAGLTTAANQMIYLTAADTAAVTTVTTYGRSLIDDADAAAARTTLGLGTISTLNGVNDANWSGADLSIANGGTGASTAAAALTALGAAPSARTITAGTGLSGGGALTANLSFSVDYGTGAGTAAQGNDSRIVNAVPNGRTVTAGNGLTGGGALTGNVAITLGTPTTLSASTTNSVSATSHSHDIDVASITQAGNVALASKGVGTYIFAKNNASTSRTPGDTIAGSSLSACSADASTSDTLSGTWVCMGQTSSGAGGTGAATLWKRQS